MSRSRLLLTVVIVLAVSIAPVASALASVQSLADVAGENCHEVSAKLCPDCEDQASIVVGKCPGDGSKCCKLTGTIVALPGALVTALAIDRAVDVQGPPDRYLKPLTPPPRS